MNRCRCKKKVCCCPGPPGPPGPPGSGQQPENDLLASGLLTVADNRMQLLGGFNIVDLTEGVFAGQPTWRVTTGPVEQVPHVLTFGELSQTPTSPAFFLRMALVPPITPGVTTIDFYISDGDGNVLNPKTLFQSVPGPLAAFFHVLRSGTQQFTAP